MIRQIILCSSAFLLLVLGTKGFADEHFPFVAEVTREAVNVRAGPSANFEKIDKLTKGSRVVVLGRSYEWLKVQPTQTAISFIRTDYLSKPSDDGIAVVTGDNVNIRAAAGSNAASLGQVKKGTLVKVLAAANGWSRLLPVVGTAAWIHQDFLKEVSAQVPDSMLIPAVQAPSTVSVKVSRVVLKTVTSSISLRGMLEPLAQAPRSDVHYEIVVDQRAVYYLQDIPQIAFFANAVVDVEGELVPDWQKSSMYPLVRVNKISLVL